MKKRTGFTLIELMIVVLIVAVLAAVLVPFMRARVEAAKWSEGKAGAGTIASALRAYAAEQGIDGIYGTLAVGNLFKESDLRGKYFALADYELTNVSYDETRTDYPLQYTIVVSAPIATWKVSQYTLDHTGAWAETQAGTP
ncbi:MAG: type II secretion system protein [Planctomycetota bacterium]|jgi:prepilin-type N-terminal cleavage/methylation domain-containing protein